MHARPHPTRCTRRGSVIIAVIWAIAIAAVVVSSIQLFSFRQDMLGMSTRDRIQARWAARSGLEQAISVMALHTESPVPLDSFAIMRDFEATYAGETGDATWDIRRAANGRDYAGPMDEHSRMNLNKVGGAELMILEDITPDIVAAIVDWADTDEEVSLFGAERDYYLTLAAPYEPRNAPYRSLPEMELVAGVKPIDVRGEDWNLNARRDPNEDDGARSFPDDEANGVLNAGWSEWLTATSVEGGATGSGLPRIYLRRAEPEELMDRLEVDEEQATTLIAFGRSPRNTLAKLITSPLSNINVGGQVTTQPVNRNVTPLDEEQLRAVLAETSVLPAFDRQPGRININTAPRDLLYELIVTGLGLDPVLADEIIYMRDSRPEGIVSILDLREIPDVSDQLLERMADIFTTSSNVFTVSVQARRKGSGVRSEIIAVVDRSSLPIRILEYREQ